MPTSNLTDWLQQRPNPLDSLVLNKFLLTLAVLVGIWLLRRIVRVVVHRRVTEETRVYQLEKFVSYTAAAVMVISLGRIWWSEGFQSLATVFGLLSAGLAIALQDLIKDMAGWVFILTRTPFKIGDRIQVGDDAGDVVDIRLFQFTLNEIGNWVQADQSTGRVIHINNSVVFTQSLANYTRGFEYIWHEIPVMVTFESDWKKAKQILLHLVMEQQGDFSSTASQKLRQAARHYMIYYKTLTPTVYTSVADSGVVLTIRYLTDPRRRRGTSQALWEAILDEFAKHPDIDLAYPTQRFYNNATEGKPGVAGVVNMGPPPQMPL